MNPKAQPKPGSFGKLNIYTCDKCRGHIVTRDVDDGVTPFMITCKAKWRCDGMMVSSMYRVFDQNMLEGFQWYRPSAVEVMLSASEVEHVSKGGLLLRQRVKDDRG